MGLPKLTVPTFNTTVPSTKQKVKFRPFLSKEEKILMLVKQSEDQDTILQAMKDIINVCMFEKLDVNKLAIFDIEFLFLQLRSKAVGEIIEVDMKCNNEVPDIPSNWVEGDDKPMKTCGGLIPFAINIDDIKVKFHKEHKNVIVLEEGIGITLKYPTIEDIKMMEDNKESDIIIITNLLENIFDGDIVYDVKDTPKQEIIDFMDNTNSDQIEEIREKFFYTMPTLEYTAKYECSKCGNKGEYTFRGITDFF